MRVRIDHTESVADEPLSGVETQELWGQIQNISSGPLIPWPLFRGWRFFHFPLKVWFLLERIIPKLPPS